MGSVGIFSGVGGLARIPSEESKIGQYSLRSRGIGQNSFRSGWDWTKLLAEQIGLVRIPQEKARLVRICSGVDGIGQSSLLIK